MTNINQQSAKMWSGRFREPLDATFESWQRSFPFDVRLLSHEIAASKAHAETIAAAGILVSDELKQMLYGLDRVIPLSLEESAKLTNLDALRDAHKLNSPGVGFVISAYSSIVALNPQAEDIHHFVELQLTKIIGDLALKLHTGRSRNEQIATDMRLFVREAIDNTLASLTAWRKALIDLAESAGEATMPSYTHLQRAEPVLIVHWLLAYVTMIERDASRLTDARKRMNLCPLGSGAVAGATLALDRNLAARALNFDAPTPNSMDATSDRDFALDFTQAIATLGIHISRFAEELTLYSTAEFGFLDLPERFSTGSSAMPQKKNPDLTELIRGKSGRLLGAATTLATLIKGLPLAYNKDLQEGQEPVFDAADTIAGILSVLPAFTASLKFRFDTMKTAAHSGYLNAMAAATYLTDKGIPFRKAHEHIGNAVRLGLETQRELQQLTLEELRAICPQFGEDFFSAITLEATLDCHDVIGGTARPRVKTALDEAKSRLTEHA
ncbi:argininosuccinate lyase [Tunturibacter empetritectus]|uniref:Argininosuccinate lyase n=1 Tax=Tunturiibacter lichenicola TaxID=2051959 RepID=A0A7W8N313_9BACT|nr:argininosuccinate lyase [Edaphobacter lichenicola]MBB5343967.1 argininosuccinate lyase [Edaphobacter lichenicola]